MYFYKISRQCKQHYITLEFIKGMLWAGLHFHCFLLFITGINLIFQGDILDYKSSQNALIIYCLVMMVFLVNFFVNNANNNQGLNENAAGYHKDKGYVLCSITLVLNLTLTHIF